MINRHGVRVRTTAAAVGVVAVVLIAASVAMVLLLRRSLTQDVRAAALLRAEELATEGHRTGPSLPSTDDDEFVQVIDVDGDVVAATANVGDSPAVEARDADDGVVELPIDDDPFLVVAIGGDTGDTVVVGRSLDTVVESTVTVVGLLAVGVPALLLIVGAITWRVVGASLRPVESIRAQVGTITSERLDRRVPVPGTGDEIERLAATMNEMLHRLESGTLRQRRFVSDASHELRSPVSTIRNQAEVALAHPSSTSVDELARSILDEDLRLQHLVEDLLVLARMDEGSALATKMVDLDEIVFAEVQRRNGTALIDTRNVSGGRVSGDERALERLVSNLVDNACRYSRSKVAIALSEENGRVVLQVDDDGAGIAPDDRARVFERFVRLDEARARTSGGAGLGLAIVAEVAARHGGEVEVLPAPLGGSRFEVRLPAAD